MQSTQTGEWGSSIQAVQTWRALPEQTDRLAPLTRSAALPPPLPHSQPSTSLSLSVERVHHSVRPWKHGGRVDSSPSSFLAVSVTFCNGSAYGRRACVRRGDVRARARAQAQQ
jgi:redox-sensitive bicupin YhaK (pirin superfamily)